MKRVFVVHNWTGSPQKHWYPWLKKELAKKGFAVKVLKMPSPMEPKIKTWVDALAVAVGKPDDQTYFVGHSIGCQTIMRYLQKREEKIGGMVFIAPWTNLRKDSDMEKEDWKIANPWIKTPIDFIAVQQRTKHITCFFSQDDYYVPITEAAVFRENLSAHVIIEEKQGHYTTDDGIREVPQVLSAILKL